jgi:hypothetical protein
VLRPGSLEAPHPEDDLKSLLVAAALSLVLLCPCLAAVDVAVYPGAVVDEQVSQSLRNSNPENVAYSTTDSFDKVDEFYKKQGSEDLPHTRNISENSKYVLLQFPGKKSRYN